jgi:hypothetical protein
VLCLLLRRVRRRHLAVFLSKKFFRRQIFWAPHMLFPLESQLLHCGPERKVFLELVRFKWFSNFRARRVTYLPKRVWLSRVVLTTSFLCHCRSDRWLFRPARSSVGARRGKIKLDAHTFAVVFEFLGWKICPIIRDDVVWYSEAKCYLLDEVYCYCRILSCYWSCFDPLGEFVDCGQHINVPTWPRFM